MWARLGRRVLDFSIGFFALLGFVLVPLGERTAFEHVKAIFSTGPAVEAGRDLVGAGARLRQRIFAEHAGPTFPTEPRPAGSSDPSAPRPEPPPLAHASAPDAGVDASLTWPET
jgi:hypothetical protein